MMKKILSLLVVAVAICSASFGQFFQGTFTNTGNKISFKMKPSASLTTAISYMEFSFRYLTASTPAFTVNNITSNVTNFPSLNIQRLPDYTEGNYTYVKFVHNTGTVASRTYDPAAELEVFSITVDGDPAAFANFDMSTDLVSQNFVFGVVDGAGNFFDPGASPALYGPGFFTVGDGQFLPLTNVPLPVRFLGFTVSKNNNTALLNWSVELEDANTASYEIQRSLSGVDFSTVATVAPLNNGRSSNSYNFTQENLDGIRNSGVIYFRIKQIDRDGKFVYTPIRSVRLNGKGLVFGVYPNPVKATANVSFDLADNADVIIKVIDASGKQVATSQVQGFKGANITKVNMSTLASGSYTMSVQAGTEVKTTTIVKVNQ